MIINHIDMNILIKQFTLSFQSVFELARILVLTLTIIKIEYFLEIRFLKLEKQYRTFMLPFPNIKFYNPLFESKNKKQPSKT